MGSHTVSRDGFVRLLGVTGSLIVGLSVAATPRHLVALVQGKSTLKKVTTLKTLKAGVNGPFSFKVDGAGASTNQIFLVLASGSKVSALEATCRHKGCAVSWIGTDKKFECPCHGSQYSSTGTVVQGPAAANLYRHTAVVKAGQVWVMTTRASM